MFSTDRSSTPSTIASLFRNLAQTPDDRSLLIGRLVLGAVMLPHGVEKIGAGYAPTMSYFSSLGIPLALGWLAIAAELGGSVLLLAGLAGRLAALAIGITMSVAALLDHLQYGLFMNWSGTQKGEGYEFHLIVIALCTMFVVCGSGAVSADRWLTTKR
jgi:putative oxidoreductase